MTFGEHMHQTEYTTRSPINLNLIEPGVPYGQRLLPHITTASAEQDPGRVIALMPKSSKALSEPVEQMTARNMWMQLIVCPGDSLSISGSRGNSKLLHTSWVRMLARLNFSSSSWQGINDFRYLIVEVAAIKVGLVVC